jgi:hypothetical protein
MKRYFHSIVKSSLITIALFVFSYSNAQSDSVQSVFERMPKLRIPLHYSYLKWDFGYTGFAFNNTYIGGTSFDIIGAVFNNDLGLSFGLDGASKPRGRGVAFAQTDIVQAYSSIYFKAEPMLNPDKLVNFSAPLKLAYSIVSYTNPYTGGYGRRGLISYGFPSFSFGLNGFINMFKTLSLGVGADYRFGFGSRSAVATQDYNNFFFSFIFRIKWYTRKIGKGPASGNDYYSPQLKYQQ